jgi:hypothetical protein
MYIKMDDPKCLKIQIDYLRKKFESEINLLKTENKNLKKYIKIPNSNFIGEVNNI